MEFEEYVATWRPFQLFSECLEHECDMEFALQAVGEDWYDKYISSQDSWVFYYRIIEGRGLLPEYHAFKDFVGKWGLYGTE